MKRAKVGFINFPTFHAFHVVLLTEDLSFAEFFLGECGYCSSIEFILQLEVVLDRSLFKFLANW